MGREALGGSGGGSSIGLLAAPLPKCQCGDSDQRAKELLGKRWEVKDPPRRRPGIGRTCPLNCVASLLGTEFNDVSLRCLSF